MTILKAGMLTFSLAQIAFITGLIVLFVYAMIGLEKVSSLVWGLSKDQTVKLGDTDRTYTSYDLNVMRLFIVLTIIYLISLLLAIPRAKSFMRYREEENS